MVDEESYLFIEKGSQILIIIYSNRDMVLLWQYMTFVNMAAVK